jgi:hypothetical protein
MTNLAIFKQATMSSVTLAELVEKEHKNVLADIRKLQEFYIQTYSAEKSADLIKSSTYTDSLGRTYPCFELSKDACLDLVTGYSLPHRHAVNQRWQELEQSTTQTSVQPQVVGELVAPSNNFNALYSVMRTIGLDNNAAAISANQAVLKVSGVNLLELTGQTHLLADKQEHWYTPTQLGQMCNPPMQPKNFNLLLAAHDLQVRVGDAWVALAAGEEYSRLFDTSKRRGNGTPVLQLKWSKRVLDIVLPKKTN